MRGLILDEIHKLASLLQQIHTDEALIQTAEKIGHICTKALQQGKKILLVGNGGSAADAQHLAAELVSRLRYDRPGLAAIALTTDTSTLTAIGNDYSFENLFSRQVEAIGQAGDVLIAISTSGKSPNIIKALQTARQKELVTIGFCGNNPTVMQAYADEILAIPSKETGKVQECHIVFGHSICMLIEELIFGAEYNPARKPTSEVA